MQFCSASSKLLPISISSNISCAEKQNFQAKQDWENIAFKEYSKAVSCSDFGQNLFFQEINLSCPNNLVALVLYHSMPFGSLLECNIRVFCSVQLFSFSSNTKMLNFILILHWSPCHQGCVGI